LLADTQVATLHFPSGRYSWYAVDDLGYYYRAPRKIFQHQGGASVPHDGGIYVTKKAPRRLRGYIYLAGGIVHVGNLTGARYAFGD
jgi:hypothetical protein